MNWIEQHPDPKILKLGIRMALYREKKPEIPTGNTGAIKEKMDAIEAVANTLMTVWRSTRLAYLKEPEFKYDDVVFDRECNSYRVGKINNDGTITVVGINKVIKKTFKESDLSHYYPGQEVESFKYVREVLNYQYEGTDVAMNQIPLWQEVEVPDKEIPTQILIGSEPDIDWQPNPEYTQFQADKDKGIILAITKQ